MILGLLAIPLELYGLERFKVPLAPFLGATALVASPPTLSQDKGAAGTWQRLLNTDGIGVDDQHDQPRRRAAHLERRAGARDCSCRWCYPPEPSSACGR